MIINLVWITFGFYALLRTFRRRCHAAAEDAETGPNEAAVPSALEVSIGKPRRDRWVPTSACTASSGHVAAWPQPDVRQRIPVPSLHTHCGVPAWPRWPGHRPWRPPCTPTQALPTAFVFYAISLAHDSN